MQTQLEVFFFLVAVCVTIFMGFTRNVCFIFFVEACAPRCMAKIEEKETHTGTWHTTWPMWCVECVVIFIGFHGKRCVATRTICLQIDRWTPHLRKLWILLLNLILSCVCIFNCVPVRLIELVCHCVCVGARNASKCARLFCIKYKLNKFVESSRQVSSLVLYWSSINRYLFCVEIVLFSI